MRKGRAPCCDKTKVKKGPWSFDEDFKLISHIQKFGHANWRALPFKAGLLRCGKSCRLRWVNYLNPDVKRGNFTLEEETLVINFHSEYGNKWSKIASHLPGRTDNEIKNVWNTYLKKRAQIINDSPSSSTALPSVSSEIISGDQHEKELQDPKKCTVSSSTTQDPKPENLPSPSSSNVSNISNLENINFTEAQEEILKFDDELFQTTLDPEFNFWFMLENTK
ncbi:hypothetical protein RND81_08G172300 [Saponaria officinalis]|uniref:Uncharacterized protein n=1 Tax=Saponaria officinalis TaxID=3572 RepID=A0AAW1J7R7_SAPOF